MQEDSSEIAEGNLVAENLPRIDRAEEFHRKDVADAFSYGREGKLIHAQ
jgi:hypothetical protein